MTFKFEAKKAVREKIYVKIALMGSAGSGKSFSALRLATGIANEIKRETKQDARILVGNTESGRGRYYANEFDYDVVDLEPPYNPELYVEFIKYAVDNGYSVLILDSTSPEWEGKGGCLDLQQQAGGKYQDWSKVTPRHEKFINALATSPIHIIATMRGKDQYEVEKDDKGKVSVKKLGVGAKQREGFEYEFTATFMLDNATNLATPQKDNTHIFNGEHNILLTEDYGRKIMEWANSGEGFSIKSIKFNTEPENNTIIKSEELSDKISEISSLAKSLADSGTSKIDIANAVKKHFVVNGKPSANYNAIEDVSVADMVIQELKGLSESN